MYNTKVTVDLTKISEEDFDPNRTLLVATMRGGEIIDQKVIKPAKEKNPRSFVVELSLGAPEDGVAGAEVVVAPADDKRNLQSKLTTRKFISANSGHAVTGVLQVMPSTYQWWRFCWFPRHYHITGQVVRHEDDCAHPIAGANVEIYDVDYCWWWYNQDLIKAGTTDVNGFFDISFTWCVPLWCLFEIIRRPPILIDPDLRDRLNDIIKERIPIKFPPPPPPPDPWIWEQQLTQLGIEVPTAGRLQSVPIQRAAIQRLTEGINATMPQQSMLLAKSALTSAVSTLGKINAKISAADLFHPVIVRPFCDEPCDWLPDIKISVTQNQPSGTVVIYEDSYAQIRFDLDHDLINLKLEANASALFANACIPDPILGNCMLLDAVGTIQIMPNLGDPNSGIYQPDVTAGVSYGVTPNIPDRLGYVKNYDRPWAGSLDIHGRFGIAANVDYYQVQMAKWTSADFLVWSADHTHVPPDAAFGPGPAGAIIGFTRSYLEESPLPLHWVPEAFAPQTVGGHPLLFKSRERFEKEYVAAHGGSIPAPDFGGWYWDYLRETQLFGLDTSKIANGTYTFRFICYRQTGVDAMSNPILTQVDMGLTGGVGRRCTTSKPELLTLYLHDNVHTAECAILTFKKNGVEVIDECAMVTLTSTDWIEVSYQAFDAAGNLDSYQVTLQKGFSPEHDILGLFGVAAVSGSSPEGPTYSAALADLVTPAIPPDWYGGAWTKKVPYDSFVAMGGSCAYNLRVRAWDRHTNGWASGPGWGETECYKNRAFTVILA